MLRLTRLVGSISLALVGLTLNVSGHAKAGTENPPTPERPVTSCPVGEPCGDGTCAVDAQCGLFAACEDDGHGAQGEDGQCVIDPEQLPIDPWCRTTCQLALPCTWSTWPAERPFGTPTSLADADARVADCTGLCSYALVNDLGRDDLLEAFTCVNASAECQSMQVHCVDPIGRLATLLQRIPAAVPASWQVAPKSLIAGPPVSQDPVLAPTDDPGLEPLPTPDDTPAAVLDGEAAGCQGASSPLGAWFVSAFVLAAFAVTRRRIVCAGNR